MRDDVGQARATGGGANVTYTYPTDGATGWRPSEIARESPYTPGELLGVPQGTPTGPYLYVMFDGPTLGLASQASVSSASLTGPSGPVEVLVADNTTPSLIGYLPTGAELIPRSPLEPQTRYTAAVQASVEGQIFTHIWSFTTGKLINSVFISAFSGDGHTFSFTIRSDAPGGTLTATGPGSPVSAPIGADGRATVSLPPSQWRICASTGGTGTAFESAGDCLSSPVTAIGAGASTPPSVTPSGPPGPKPSLSSTSSSASSAFPAKLEIARASVLRSKRRLSVLAPITSRASGRVKVAFRASGRTERFTADVDRNNRRVRINRGIPASQARLATGILTLTYDGDNDTQPQEVRLRAASRKANLDARRPVIAGGRLTASGSISKRARGVVRLQLLYQPAVGPTRTLEFLIPISNGRYVLDRKLSSDVVSDIAGRRGTVHSYTLFTGYFPARMRGEMSSYRVAGKR